MKIYGIKNCDTMKKTFDWLNEHRIEYTFHNYKEAGISSEKLNEWLSQVPLKELVNTRGTTYRKLTDADKAAVANPETAIKIIMANPSLIKRPVIETKKGLVVGLDKILNAE